MYVKSEKSVGTNICEIPNYDTLGFDNKKA